MVSANFEMINGEQFQDKIALTKADALVKVTAPWSGACQIIMPILEELASQYNDSVKFYTLDHERDASLSNIYNVTTLPTLLLFKQGRLVDKVVGMVHKSEVAKRLHSLVQQSNN